MADFDFSTLVTDRAPADLSVLRGLLSTPMEDWTEAQLAEFNLAASKGAYSYTDLNRVTACMDYLNERLTAAGYVTGYQRIVIHPEETQEPESKLPDGFTALEYIESSGTQYINTGYTMKSNLERAVIQFAYTNDHSSASLFGSENGNIGGSGKYSIVPYGSPSYYVGGSIKIPSSYIPEVNEIVTLDISTNGNTVSDQWSGGQSKTTSYTGSLNQTQSIALFGNNVSGITGQLVSMKLYSFTLFDNAEMVRNMIPCMSPENVVGLYDTVTKNFYGNSGTSSFIAGPEVPPPEPPLDPYTWYEADAQTATQMGRYLQNVSALRETLILPENTAPVPEDMVGLTQMEANNIENILGVIDNWIRNMMAAWFYSGDLYAGEV